MEKYTYIKIFDCFTCDRIAAVYADDHIPMNRCTACGESTVQQRCSVNKRDLREYLLNNADKASDIGEAQFIYPQ